MAALKTIVKHPAAKSFEVEVKFSDTVADLKNIIERKIDIPVAKQKLIFAAKVLQDEQTLRDCKFDQNCRITLVTTKYKGKNKVLLKMFEHMGRRVLLKYLDDDKEASTL